MFGLTLLPGEFVVLNATGTLSFGFLILSAYLLAALLKRFELPQITGYILAGMLLGPSILGFLSTEALEDLKLIDDLALAFIAFAAGAELRLGSLRKRRRSIAYGTACSLIIVFMGVVSAVLAFRSVFPLTAGLSFVQAFAVASILGVIAVARSPSSAIAIISETRSRGPFTDTVLGVTVVADVLTIFLFAVALSFMEATLLRGGAFDYRFFLGVGSEVLLSVIIGVVVGKGVVLYLQKVKVELIVFILGTAFLVTKASHWFAHLLDNQFDIRFHLEPMLICLTAGFFIQNRSKTGPTFLKVIERSSLPIFAVFFALSGAALELGALKTTWHFAVGLVFLRGALIWGSAKVGGHLAGDSVRFNKAYGFAFLTQAGVSLGLAKVIADRFGDLGTDLATLIIAAIAINQVVGPVAMKQALSFVGETKRARLKAITSRKNKPRS